MSVALEVLLPPFIACLVLTGIHTYLGLHVVSRGVIFVDLALAQIAALGATFAFLLGYDPHQTTGYLYSLSFTFIGAAIFSLARLRDRRIPQEAIIGITFAVSSAAAILLADRAPQGAEFVEAMLAGALLWVPWATIVKTAGIYAAIGLFHWTFRRRFLTLSLHPDVAEAEGWNVRWWDFLFYLSFGFVITSSVAMAGILLVFSFLVIPSVIAMLFAEEISTRLTIGWAVGSVVSMAGLALSWGYDFPSGPAVVCTFGLALILAAVGRYVIVSERRGIAVARVAAAVAVIAAGLWIAVTASRSTADTTTALAADADPPGQVQADDSAGRAQAALAELEASSGAPPAAAVEELLAVADSFHRMMATGEIQVSEQATQALSRAPGEAIGELLEEIAYHSPDPWVRVRGAEGLLDRGNPIGVPPLIDLLESDTPPFLKAQASDLLQQATGQTIAFAPDASPADQQHASAAWRDWWEAHKAEPLPAPAK